MKWLVVLALVACGNQQAKAPALDSIDRSCATDTDCTLTRHLGCCDTSCGRDFGAAVNAKAWSKVSSRMRGDCSKEECHVMCQQQPECREDGVAVCKAGVCELVMQKTAACTEVVPDAGLVPDAAASDDACETVDDCILYTTSGCCDRCTGTPMNRAAGARKQQEDEAACANKKVDCPVLDCKRLPVDCVNKKCVQR